uniref:Uncharacterized protein n=1 Tax=Brassica oleracea TaxID=3712 RepID=A0A3P6EZE5_BRAOL|nr:unnamed protein product [Brassica oleracea]
MESEGKRGPEKKGRRIVSIAVALVSAARCPSVARVGDLSLMVLLGGDLSLSRWLLSNRKYAYFSFFLRFNSVYQWRWSSPRRRWSSISVATKLSLGGDGAQTVALLESKGLESSPIPLSGTQATQGSNFQQDTPVERKERRSWSPTDDVVLISSWLNTSKDAVVGNEQKAAAFCKRIADYVAASTKLAGCEKRDLMHCKHRWHKINDQQKRKLAAKMRMTFSNKLTSSSSTTIKKKFTLEHAWKELHHDQKWCDLSTGRTSKKRKGEDGAQSSTSHAIGEAEEGTARPPGVKAAKSRGKKPVEGKGFCEFEWVWNVKQEDLSRRERFTKMGLLDRLLAKTKPLPEYEECLKKKLINELETPTYPDNFFRQRFRMNRRLFMHIVDRLSNECTASIRILAYGSAADTVDEYLRLGETTTRICLENFVEGIIYLFSDEYLRRPTLADLQRLLQIGEHRGFLGMIGSIDCMHWEWKNCPTAWKGQYTRGTLNDINVLDRSPIFDDIINGQGPQVTYFVNGREYHMTYYLTDEFIQGEENGSSHVDLDFDRDIPTNIANMMGVRTRIRDRTMHEQLKNDLVEHVWYRFGGDEDNN